MQFFKKILPLLNSSWFVVLLGFLVVVLTSSSIINNYFFRPHDFTHAARLTEMQLSLSAGEFPVRWSRNFGFGYGMPLFNFYAPLPYYLGQVPMSLGVSPINTIKALYLVNSLLAFTGMYLLASKLWGKWGGMVSAVLFSFSSYRALDLFVRGALGEAFALVLIPFLLYGILLMSQKRLTGILVGGVSLAAVLLSHNLTGMIAVGLAFVFGLASLLWVDKRKRTSTVVAILSAIVLGFGLSAFYTLPAFLEKSLTRVDQTITVGYFDYHNHFLCWTQLFRGEWKYGGSLPGCSDDLDFSFGTFPLVIVGLAVISVSVWGKRRDKLQIAVFLMLFVGFTFLTIGRSAFIWDAISILKYFQFPWRFLTFTHVFFAILAGGVLASNRSWKWIGVPVLVIIFISVYRHVSFFRPQSLLSESELTEFYDSSPQWIRREVSKTLNDYLPPRVRDDSLPHPIDSRVETDKGKITVLRDESARLQAKVNCDDSCEVRVNIFQFPGWKAKINGRDASLIPVSEGMPIYSIVMPAGENLLLIEYKGTLVQRAANLITLGTTVFVAAFIFIKRRKLSYN